MALTEIGFRLHKKKKRVRVGCWHRSSGSSAIRSSRHSSTLPNRNALKREPISRLLSHPIPEFQVQVNFLLLLHLFLFFLPLPPLLLLLLLLLLTRLVFFLYFRHFAFVIFYIFPFILLRFQPNLKFISAEILHFLGRKRRTEEGEKSTRFSSLRKHLNEKYLKNKTQFILILIFPKKKSKERIEKWTKQKKKGELV